jgi:hypothetical protein
VVLFFLYTRPEFNPFSFTRPLEKAFCSDPIHLLVVQEINRSASERFLFRLYLLKGLARPDPFAEGEKFFAQFQRFLAVSEFVFWQSATLLQSPANRVKVARRKSSLVAISDSTDFVTGRS